MTVVKNPTPRQIALFIAGSTALVALVLGTIVSLSATVLFPWELGLTLVVLLFSVTYLVTLYYLKKYIYRKIKLIYKSIHKQKLNPQEKRTTVDASSDILDEVEREVAEWADTQAREISELKTWQEYRRRFIGDVSHELKTPIFSIQGYLDTLLDGGMDDPEIRVKYLQRAASNVERLVTIVDDLNSITKLESGSFELDMQDFNIRTLAEEVIQDLEMSSASRNIQISFKPGADGNYRVLADRESIRQVLTNLLTNSVKYGQEGGLTKIGFYDMDRHILVEVADNGIGIEKKHLNHVFDRFYRADKSRSRAQGGSGLGLSIVKHIMEAHNQTINVRSSAGLGSTFGFTLAKA